MKNNNIRCLPGFVAMLRSCRDNTLKVLNKLTLCSEKLLSCKSKIVYTKYTKNTKNTKNTQIKNGYYESYLFTLAEFTNTDCYCLSEVEKRLYFTANNNGFHKSCLCSRSKERAEITLRDYRAIAFCFTKDTLKEIRKIT